MMSKISDLRKAMEKYSGGSSEFFRLVDDKDSAVVRFLYNGEEDLDWFVVHRVEIDGKQRYVQCTEGPDCPLCASGNRPTVRLFLQLIDYSDGQKLKLWDRGKTTITDILGLIDKYASDKPFYKRRFEIVRHGKKGDTSTSYQFFPLDLEPIDDITEHDLPEKQQLLGKDGYVLKLTLQEMKQVVDGTYSSYAEKMPARPAPSATRDGVDVF